MSKTNNKRIIAIILLALIILTALQNTIYAVSMNQRITIKNFGNCEYTLQFKRSDGVWSYITCVFAGYEENGKIYPAYCVNRGLDGVGEIPTYDVDLTKLMDDYRLWRVAINGYPYKTPEQMGVYNEYDAFLATKQAIYSILYNNDVDTYYRGGNKRGEKVFNAVKYMVNEGRYGTYTPEDYNVSINKVGNLREEANYYSQEYAVSSNTSIESYTITNTLNMPQGAYIADLNGNSKTTFSSENNFKVMIPKSAMKTDLDIKINVSTKSKSYPVFYGQTTIANTQNYLITADPYVDLVGRTNLQIKGNTATLKLKKIDEETVEALSGVTFEVKQENGEVLGNYTTNSSGEIELKNLYPQVLTLTEVATQDEYILNSTPVTVELEWNKTSSITLKNMHKKGNLRIIKVDKDDNELTLGGIEFDLVCPDGKTYSVVTDADGVIELNNINTGNPTLIEKRTKKEYKLNGEQTVRIDWNETTNLVVENEKLKSQIEVYKVDSEDNEWKLAGVEFDVYDKNMKYIETITTDENGYAITSNIPIGDKKGVLYVKERKTDELHILNSEVLKINVEADIVSTLNLTNDRIKGKIKVIKTSQDDNFINNKKAGEPIYNVGFEVYNSKNILVDEIVTDEDGIAITKLLDKDIYHVRETKSGEWYLLNTEEFEAEIVNNGDIIELNITNESEKPQVDIEKTGIIQTTANEEIKYDFKIKNTGNVPLNNFTWFDYLPTDYVRITKLITGTYNQDLDYSIYYKTNKNDYRLLKDNLNTKVNNYIDFSNLELEENEYVTEFKADFGTVDIGLESEINPYIFVRVNGDVQENDTFTNKTRIEGYHKTYMVWDEDDHTTKVYEKKIEVKKLPRTGE